MFTAMFLRDVWLVFARLQANLINYLTGNQPMGIFYYPEVEPLARKLLKTSHLAMVLSQGVERKNRRVGTALSLLRPGEGARRADDGEAFSLRGEKTAESLLP